MRHMEIDYLPRRPDPMLCGVRWRPQHRRRVATCPAAYGDYRRRSYRLARRRGARGDWGGKLCNYATGRREARGWMPPAESDGGSRTRNQKPRSQKRRRQTKTAGRKRHPNPRHQRHHQKQRLPTDTSTGRDVHLQTPHTQPPLESTRERGRRGGTIIRGLRHYRRRMSRLIYISFSLLVGFYSLFCQILFSLLSDFIRSRRRPWSQESDNFLARTSNTFVV